MNTKKQPTFLAKGTRPFAIQNDAAVAKHTKNNANVAGSFQSGLDVLEKLFPYISLPPVPTVTTFLPLHISPGLDERVANDPPINGKLSGGLCQLVGAPSAAILTRDVPSSSSWIKNDKKPTSTLFMTSKGIRESKSSMNAELVNSVVKFEHISIACRASILGATSANFAREIFFFDLTPTTTGIGNDTVGNNRSAPSSILASATQPTALTYELDLNKGSKVTACTVADIAVLLPVPTDKHDKHSRGGAASSLPPRDMAVFPSSSSKPYNNEPTAPSQPPMVIGQQALMLLGDSDGRIHFSIASKVQYGPGGVPVGPTTFTVLQAGSWTAHKASIVAITTRADAIRPLWRINVNTSDNGFPQPTAAPGSAVISMARDGEVNVWQPSFTNSLNVRSKPEQVLTVFTPLFHLAGTFMMRLVSDVTIEQVEAVEKETRSRTPEKKSLKQQMSEMKLAAAEAKEAKDSTKKSKKSKKHRDSVSDKQGGNSSSTAVATPASSSKGDPPPAEFSEKSSQRKASTLPMDSRRVSLAIPENSTESGASTDVEPVLPPPPPIRYKQPSHMTIDPSCQHLIVTFDDGSVDIWPLPGLHKGTSAVHQPIQTCRERIWTSIHHDDAITSARVWTNYLEPFLNQIGGTTSSTGNGMAGVDVKAGPPVGVLGTGGYTVDILKKLASASTLTTSSVDRSVSHTASHHPRSQHHPSPTSSTFLSQILLWLFSPAVSNLGQNSDMGNNTSTTRFLQPYPARRFHFSSIPSQALCFHSSLSDYKRLSVLTLTNAMLQDLADAPWQVTAVVDGRVVTVSKAPKCLLLKATMPEIKVVAAGTWSSLFGKEDMVVEDLTSNKSVHSLDSLADSQSSTSSLGRAGAEAGAQMLTMSFIPVISPVLSACHASEVMGRRAQRFNG